MAPGFGPRSGPKPFNIDCPTKLLQRFPGDEAVYQFKDEVARCTFPIATRSQEFTSDLLLTGDQLTAITPRADHPHSHRPRSTSDSKRRVVRGVRKEGVWKLPNLN